MSAAVSADGPELRETVAIACRLLAAHGLVEGILGHVSARVSDDELVVRCRGGDRERGLRRTSPDDVWRLTLDGRPVDLPDGYSPPKELPIHTELLRQRPDCGAVIHAHPPAALLCGLAGLVPRAVFGAYNIPAMSIARSGVPVFARPILITRPELANEMLVAMGGANVCLLLGHGITVAAATVEQATVLALNLNLLLEVTVELARLGARPPELDPRDLAELPDLGSAFNDRLTWQALVAELDDPRDGRLAHRHDAARRSG
jgi:ribulose-5-phosphate 4-epimerase/fuculose-1-phosphate aldolase